MGAGSGPESRPRSPRRVSRRWHEYESGLSWFIEHGVTSSLEALTTLAGEKIYSVRRKIPVVGGVLIDGASGPPVTDATILTQDGRILSIGRRSDVVIPRDAFVVHAEGKTILPRLWYMHAHYSQVKFGPVTLPTALRLCATSEIEIPTIRDALDAGRGIGPHIVFAGIIDGAGPRAMGGWSSILLSNQLRW